MPRTTEKKNKTIYQLKREELGLTREKASELLGIMGPERIERIESGRFLAYPEEVVKMAEKYQEPHLCNYFCANECEIGKQYVPEIRVRHLSQIVLEMIASLNTVKRQHERLVEITADGKIASDELEDFVRIQDELERISITVETLRLWTEKKLASGAIDIDEYNQIKENMEAE